MEMSISNSEKLLELFAKHEEQLLQNWLKEQSIVKLLETRRVSAAEAQKQSSELLRLLGRLPKDANTADISTSVWSSVRDYLALISSRWAEQGLSSSETALFIFSLKQPLSTLLRSDTKDLAEMADLTWAATLLLDNLGLYTIEQYQRTRDEIITRQKVELHELSTPVVQLWDEILAVPLIGTLDSTRTQIVMENILNKIVETKSRIIILDITGVPVVDTLVAQYLMKTVQATRLMGAECFVSGISPQIAQTIVQLGLTLSDVVTKATLKEAFTLALKRLSIEVTRRS
jgi:rsbT co-antagonist protein RsbR